MRYSSELYFQDNIQIFIEQQYGEALINPEMVISQIASYDFQVGVFLCVDSYLSTSASHVITLHSVKTRYACARHMPFAAHLK